MRCPPWGGGSGRYTRHDALPGIGWVIVVVGSRRTGVFLCRSSSTAEARRDSWLRLRGGVKPVLDSPDPNTSSRVEIEFIEDMLHVTLGCPRTYHEAGGDLTVG